MKNPINSTVEDTKDDAKVTVITWPPSYSSGNSRHSYLSEGHSALRTYSGGPDGKGVYISFWPGKNKWFLSCAEQNQENKDDISLCHQPITHFHSSDDDDLAYRNNGDIKPKTNEIIGLNIEAINKAALNKKEFSQEWTPYYNCSDLTLELLERGGLYKLVDVRRYGWKTIVSFGYLTSIVLLETINLLWSLAVQARYRKLPAMIADLKKRKVKQYSFIVYSEPVLWFLGRLGLKLNNPYYVLSELVISGVIGALLAGYTTYQYSLYSFAKSKIPKKFARTVALKDALKAGVIAFSAELIDYFLYQYFKEFSLPSFKHSFLLYFLKDFAERKKTKNVGRYYLLSVIITNLALVAFPILLKYLLDTIATPKQIQKLAEKSEKIDSAKVISEAKIVTKASLPKFSHVILISEFSSVPKNKHIDRKAIYLLPGNSSELLIVAWYCQGAIHTKNIPLQLLDNFSLSHFPKQVQDSIKITYEQNPNLVKKLTIFCKNSNSRYPTFLESVYNNRYKILSGALTFAGVAFFAYRNSIQTVYQKEPLPELESYRQTKTFQTTFGKTVLLNN